MAGGVTPKQVYQALLDAGASTIQAIAIMANAINESTLDPEAVGDQGTSFGIVQEHGSQYAGLVTGNPGRDLNQQVRVLAQNGGFRAASGANAGEAAGNFAANYERCVGCQANGAQYNSRVANAATVAGWVSSGKWPTSAGSVNAGTAGASNTSGSGTSTSSTSAACAWGFTLGGGKVAGVVSLPQADICFLKKTTIRHIVGGGLLAAGFIIGLPGVVIILAFGFRASGAAQAVSQVVNVVPAGRAASAGARAAGGAAGAREAREVQQPRRLRPIRQRPPNYRPPADQGATPTEFHHE